MDPIEARAHDFTLRAHHEQEYGGGTFHQRHLARVVATLRRFGEHDPVLLAAGWLHDVLEDTATTLDEVRAAFGAEVAELVFRLTDAPGPSRRERQTRTHAKIRGDTRAVRVKLADRIANVESTIERRHHLLGMYRKEYRKFRKDLHRVGEHEEMWRHLDRLIAGPARRLRPRPGSARGAHRRRPRA